MHYLRWYRRFKDEANSAKPVIDGRRECSRCGEIKPLGDFSQDKPSHCKPCDAERKREWHRGHPVTSVGPRSLPEIPCANCGNEFQSGGIRRHCSPECAAVCRLADQVKNVAIRRARQARVETESFRKGEIFDRDGWVCRLCDKPIDRDLKWPDGGSVSLDHIVPISLGGAHTRANTQAAHLFCNLSKHNRVA